MHWEAPDTPTRRSRGPAAHRTRTKGKDGKEYFSICKYLRGVAYGEWTDARPERRLFRKALNSQTLASGGVLLPPEFSTEFIEMLRAKAVVRSLNPSTYDMKSDTLILGGQATGATAYWIQEGADMEAKASEPTFNQLELVVKECIGFCKLQNKLLRDSSPAADQIVKRDLVKVLQLSEDLAFIQGRGGTQPRGVYRDPDVTHTILGGGNGAALTYDDILDAMYVIEASNGTYSGSLWNPRTKNTLRQLKDGVGRYILEIGNVEKGINDSLLGYPVKWTTQVPTNLTFGTSGAVCSYGIVGNWPEFIIGQKGDINMTATDVGGDSFKYDQTWVRAVLMVDCLVRQKAEFSVIDGITT